MTKKTSWKEVWSKDLPKNSGRYLHVEVMYDENTNVAFIEGYSVVPLVFPGIILFPEPAEYVFSNKIACVVVDYVEAIEWGQKIAEQWFVKYKLQQNKE